jgi:hypothetical protein
VTTLTPRSRLVTSLLAIAALVGSFVVWNKVVSIRAGTDQVDPDWAFSGYRTTDSIEFGSSVYRTSPRTVFIFIRSSCPTCEANRAEFRLLVSAIRGLNNGTSIVVATGTPESAQEIAYAKDIGVGAEFVVGYPAGVRLRSVPTVVTVDRRGKVVYSRSGTAPQDGIADWRARIIDSVR